MRFNLKAAVGIAAGSIGLIAGALIPKPPQTYGMSVVSGTTKADQAMKGCRKSGCLFEGVGP